MLSECRYQGICLTSFLKLRIQYLMLVLPPLRAGAPQYNRLNTLGSQIFVKLNCRWKEMRHYQSHFAVEETEEGEDLLDRWVA